MNKTNFFRASAEDFKKIPGSPIAYWIGSRYFDLFAGQILKGRIEGRIGLATGNNDKYMRIWFEVTNSDIGFNINRNQAKVSGLKWFPYDKAGDFRKWYGNIEFVVNWFNDGEKLQTIMHPDGKRIWAHNFNLEYIFKAHIGWSNITSGAVSFRWYDKGFLFDASANAAFTADNYNYLLALLNTIVIRKFSQILNPTIHFNPGDFHKLPYVCCSVEKIKTISQRCIAVSRCDWDTYETSWDFTVNPLVNEAVDSTHSVTTLESLYASLRDKWAKDCEEMRRLEIENNRIFIKAYGLQEELSPEVPWNEITLTCNPWYRYKVKCEDGDAKSEKLPRNAELEERLKTDTVKELISYAVGCMMGRYSLEKTGLILADQGASEADYYTKIGVDKAHAKFPVDEDGIIPILDNVWFADDIVTRFKEFIKVVYGEEHFFENMAWIKEALGKDIRSYFTKDFYKDHLQRYQNRPIYWLFQSPKGAFRALVYMHRYKPDMVGGVLGYLRSLQTKIDNQLEVAMQIGADETKSATERVKANKEAIKLSKIKKELDVYEKDVLYPLSTRRIEIDLDDGVKVNYRKFGVALYRVPAMN